MFTVKVTGVVAFIITAIVFIMLVILVSDLMDVYFGSESQMAELPENDDKDGNQESSRRLNN